MSPHFPDGVTGGAAFSRDRRYRYRLERRWGDGPRVCWVLLNPSSADALADDPTLRRCVNFSRSWGAGSAEVVNLFALISTDPRGLLVDPDPIGPRNVACLRAAVKDADLLIVGWGNLPSALADRVASITAGLPADSWCLGRTARGNPRHPLYLAKDTPRVPFRASR